MKCLTVRQPHAGLIALKYKRLETRSWSTKHRGPLAIHAGKMWTKAMRERWGWGKQPDPVLGCVLCIVNLVAVHPVESLTNLSDQELAVGDFSPGRFAWELVDVELIEPVPAKGKLGLWDWDMVPG